VRREEIHHRGTEKAQRTTEKRRERRFTSPFFSLSSSVVLCASSVSLW